MKNWQIPHVKAERNVKIKRKSKMKQKDTPLYICEIYFPISILLFTALATYCKLRVFYWAYRIICNAFIIFLKHEHRETEAISSTCNMVRETHHQVAFQDWQYSPGRSHWCSAGLHHSQKNASCAVPVIHFALIYTLLHVTSSSELVSR
jgi:hypothetical protein